MVENKKLWTTLVWKFFPFSFEKLAYERVLFASEHKGAQPINLFILKIPLFLYRRHQFHQNLQSSVLNGVYLLFFLPQEPYHVTTAEFQALSIRPFSWHGDLTVVGTSSLHSDLYLILRI